MASVPAGSSPWPSASRLSPPGCPSRSAGSTTAGPIRSPTTPSSRRTSSISPRNWSPAGSSASWPKRTTASSRGRSLAEIDPIPYRDKVNVAQAQLDSALAELDRQRADLARTRKEVPIQIEIARRTFAAAVADRARAEESLKLTEDDVEKGIDEARAELKAARADLVLALADHARISNLERRGSATRQELDQMVRARDAARAHVELAEARLAKARLRADADRRRPPRAGGRAEVRAEGGQGDRPGGGRLRRDPRDRASGQGQGAVRRAGPAGPRGRRERPGIHPGPRPVPRRGGQAVPPPGRLRLGGLAAVVSMYNPDLLYVEANLEEDRLPGVEPGNAVRIELDAFAEPFRGRVVWINKSTGAQFALMPRNVVSGEFTRVVQRVPVRIEIERDDRWPRLRAGLSATVAIAHGPGDAAWAAVARPGRWKGSRRRNTTPRLARAGR